MKRLILLIMGLLITNNVWATQIQYGTIWAANGQVTSTNLNGNFSNVSNVVNGNLDNGNADTSAGYRFYQTVSVLPAAGNTGQVYFLTSDNSLNFDTGSSFIKTIGINGSPAQGDIVYYGTNLTYLDVGTSGQFLETQGAAANPIWATVNYTNVTPPYVKVSEVENSGTNGGSSVTGSWITRVLNNKDVDSANIATLSSNQVSLPAGTYIVNAFSEFYSTAAQIRLQNITASTTLAIGMSGAGTGSGGITVPLIGEFTLGSTSSVALQYQAGTATSTNGLGVALGYGNEVYTMVQFTKVS